MRKRRWIIRVPFLDYTKVIELKTLLDVSPCGMKFIGYKTIEKLNRISYIECTRFEVAIYEDEYGIRHDYYCPENPLDTRRPKMNVIRWHSLYA
ncbi:hypothetical protein [Bacteroides bouchesdurhonensis]